MFGMDAETYFMKLNIYLCLSLAVIGFWAAMSDFPYTHEGLDTYLSFFPKIPSALSTSEYRRRTASMFLLFLFFKKPQCRMNKC